MRIWPIKRKILILIQVFFKNTKRVATKVFEDVLYRATKEGNEPGNEPIFDMLGFFGYDEITPYEPTNPSEYKVEEYYNDYVKYLFKWNI